MQRRIATNVISHLYLISRLLYDNLYYSLYYTKLYLLYWITELIRRGCRLLGAASVPGWPATRRHSVVWPVISGWRCRTICLPPRCTPPSRQPTASSFPLRPVTDPRHRLFKHSAENKTNYENKINYKNK